MVFLQLDLEVQQHTTTAAEPRNIIASCPLCDRCSSPLHDVTWTGEYCGWLLKSPMNDTIWVNYNDLTTTEPHR